VSGGVNAKTSLGGNVVKNGPIGFAPNYTAAGVWTCGPHTMSATYAATQETATLSR